MDDIGKGVEDTFVPMADFEAAGRLIVQHMEHDEVEFVEVVSGVAGRRAARRVLPDLTDTPKSRLATRSRRMHRLQHHHAPWNVQSQTFQ